MRKRDHNLFTNAASLLVCGLLAGVVVAAAAFPAVAMSGLAAKAGAETFDKLPRELTLKQSPQMSYVYAADNKTLLATMYDENRRDVTKLADIGDLMRNAIIAAEDHDFYKHNGVDLNGVARAFVNNQSGAQRQGASTLTMQYVRLAISYSATSPKDIVAATEDTTARKLREARYAMAIDKEMSKDEILLRYLNIAYFGNGAYGIWAASQVYFGKPPNKLKVEEAALLAGLVRSPSSYDPTTAGGKQEALGRRNWVVDQMLEIGAINEQQATAAKATKLVVKDKRTPNGCVATSVPHWGFFCDFFYRWWLEQEAFGATPYERERQLRSGGYRIVTTLDVKTQDAAKKNVEQYYKTSKSNPNALMVAAVEPGTGRVRALAVNRNYKLDDPKKPQNALSSDPRKRSLKIRGTNPNTTNPLLTGGGDIHGYQAGSTFKMFTMVAARDHHDQHQVAVQVDVRHRRVQPGRLQGHPLLLPEERQPEPAGAVQHVDRLRPLGEHVLRAAGGDGRRGERGGRGEAAGHQVPGQQRRLHGQQQGGGQQLGRVHAGRFLGHSAGPGELVRHAGRRRQALRADPGAADHRPQRHQARHRQPGVRPGGGPRGGAGRDRRGALPGG